MLHQAKQNRRPNSHKKLISEIEISAYLHRTRHRMLMEWTKRAATLSHIAEALGVHPANLTRHARVLEAAGLIRLIEKRDTGRNLEKYYAATATSFEVLHTTGSLKAPHKVALGYLRSELTNAIQRLPEDKPALCLSVMESVRIPVRKAEHFADELRDLVSRYAAAQDPSADAYHLLAALYPGDPNIADTSEVVTIHETGNST